MTAPELAEAVRKRLAEDFPGVVVEHNEERFVVHLFAYVPREDKVREGAIIDMDIQGLAVPRAAEYLAAELGPVLRTLQ